MGKQPRPKSSRTVRREVQRKTEKREKQEAKARASAAGIILPPRGSSSDEWMRNEIMSKRRTV